MRRSQYGCDRRSEWREVPHDACPRFDRTTASKLQLLADGGEDGADGAEHKVMFSFVNDQHVTPWIVLSDGKGKGLTHVLFTFEHVGDQVSGLTWTTWYAEGKGRPAEVHVEYVFEDASPVDPQGALTGLFVSSVLLSIVSAGIVGSRVLLG